MGTDHCIERNIHCFSVIFRESSVLVHQRPRVSLCLQFVLLKLSRVFLVSCWAWTTRGDVHETTQKQPFSVRVFSYATKVRGFSFATKRPQTTRSCLFHSPITSDSGTSPIRKCRSPIRTCRRRQSSARVLISMSRRDSDFGGGDTS